MKLKSLAVLALASVWGAGGWWWYACSIKGFCGEHVSAHTAEHADPTTTDHATTGVETTAKKVDAAVEPATTKLASADLKDKTNTKTIASESTKSASDSNNTSSLPKLTPKTGAATASTTLSEPSDAQAENLPPDSTERTQALAAANEAADKLAEEKLASNGAALVAATTHASSVDKVASTNDNQTTKVNAEPVLAVGDPIPTDPEAVINHSTDNKAQSQEQEKTKDKDKKADKTTDNKEANKEEASKSEKDSKKEEAKNAKDNKDDKANQDDEEKGDKLTVETIGKDDSNSKDNKDNKDKKKVKSIKAARLYFPFRSSRPELADEAKDYVDDVVTYLKEHPKASITLTGHTDNKGDADYNEKVGLKRAEAVKKLLVRQGAPADQIKVDSRGETRPIANNKEEEGRKKNRRVELTPNR